MPSVSGDLKVEDSGTAGSAALDPGRLVEAARPSCCSGTTCARLGCGYIGVQLKMADSTASPPRSWLPLKGGLFLHLKEGTVLQLMAQTLNPCHLHFKQLRAYQVLYLTCTEISVVPFDDQALSQSMKFPPPSQSKETEIKRRGKGETSNSGRSIRCRSASGSSQPDASSVEYPISGLGEQTTCVAGATRPNGKKTGHKENPKGKDKSKAKEKKFKPQVPHNSPAMGTRSKTLQPPSPAFSTRSKRRLSL